jgi:hypothetical protein
MTKHIALPLTTTKVGGTVEVKLRKSVEEVLSQKVMDSIASCICSLLVALY